MSRLTTQRLGELYAGTLQLVAQHGYDKVTMDQIADATRSSKATLYRQWGGKVALVVEALRCSNNIDAPVPDTGSLRGDLLALMEGKDVRTEDDSALVTAIMHAMRENEELATAVRSEILTPHFARVGIMLQRAIERREVEADCPALDHVELILMAPMLRTTLDGRMPDADFMHSYVEAVLLPALGVH